MEGNKKIKCYAYDESTVITINEDIVDIDYRTSSQLWNYNIEFNKKKGEMKYKYISYYKPDLDEDVILNMIKKCESQNRIIKVPEKRSREWIQGLRAEVDVCHKYITFHYYRGLLGGNYTGAEDYILNGNEVVHMIKNDAWNCGSIKPPDIDKLNMMLKEVK